MFTKLPKVNLHHHLEGAIRPETFLEVARRHNLDVPIQSITEASSYLQVAGQEPDLARFLEKIARTFAITQFPGVLQRVAREIVADAARHQVRYLEVRFGPWLHVESGRPIEEPVEEVLAGLKEASSRHGVKTGLIISALRHDSPARNEKLAQVAVRYREHGVVGFDIAGDEAAYPAATFRNAFAIARDGGLGITVHAGEAGPAENVWEAVAVLGAARIGHGIHLIENEELLARVRDRNVTLEVCPTSNWHTNAVPSLKAHPVRTLCDAGVRISIGDDDPTTSGINISHEYELLHKEFGFSKTELAELVLQGVEAAFLSEQEKHELKNELAAALRAWGESG